MPAAPSRRTILSAPCLVRLKTRARSTPLSLRSRVSSAAFSGLVDEVTVWSTRSAVVAAGVTATSAGLVR